MSRREKWGRAIKTKKMGSSRGLIGATPRWRPPSFVYIATHRCAVVIVGMTISTITHRWMVLMVGMVIGARGKSLGF